MATIEELRLQQEEAEKKELEHKEWRKEKRWFASLPRELFFDGERGSVVYGIEDLTDVLETYKDNSDKNEVSVKVKFLYRTNGWREDLPEID